MKMQKESNEDLLEIFFRAASHALNITQIGILKSTKM
jgi:hypothetical protein